jgi:hypothetical protein
MKLVSWIIDVITNSIYLWTNPGRIEPGPSTWSHASYEHVRQEWTAAIEPLACQLTSFVMFTVSILILEMCVGAWSSRPNPNSSSSCQISTATLENALMSICEYSRMKLTQYLSNLYLFSSSYRPSTPYSFKKADLASRPDESYDIPGSHVSVARFLVPLMQCFYEAQKMNACLFVCIFCFRQSQNRF